MNTNTLLLSTQTPFDTTLQEWFGRLQTLVRTLAPVSENVHLELHAQRLGERGQLEDHIGIERVETLFTLAQEHGLIIASLRIPVSLGDCMENQTQEISNIDGWADLAGYSDIPRIRLHFLDSGELFDPAKNTQIASMLNYILESQIQCTLTVENKDALQLQALLDTEYPDTPNLTIAAPMPTDAGLALENVQIQADRLSHLIVPLMTVPDESGMESLHTQVQNHKHTIILAFDL
jgi:hypothetical protein